MAEIESQSPQGKTLTIDGKEYDLDKLSEEARNQVVNLRVTDQEIARVKQQLAIYQTARSTYAQALKKALPEVDAAEFQEPTAH